LLFATAIFYLPFLKKLERQLLTVALPCRNGWSDSQYQGSQRDSVQPSFVARISAEDLFRAEGGCISEQEVVDLLELENITIVEDWRRYRQIVAIKSDTETWMYPVWQFARSRNESCWVFATAWLNLIQMMT